MKSDYDTVADALYAMPFDPTTYRVEAAKICVAHGWEYDEFIGQIVQRMSDKIRGISVSSYTNQWSRAMNCARLSVVSRRHLLLFNG
jgi:hypothetical protein